MTARPAGPTEAPSGSSEADTSVGEAGSVPVVGGGGASSPPPLELSLISRKVPSACRAIPVSWTSSEATWAPTDNVRRYYPQWYRGGTRDFRNNEEGRS